MADLGHCATDLARRLTRVLSEMRGTDVCNVAVRTNQNPRPLGCDEFGRVTTAQMIEEPKNVAFQDDGLIQYKSEVMLRIFEKDVMPLIGGRAKVMIVTSSRVAGLRYFQIVKEKLAARGATYKALYAFSDFVHPETNVPISEHGVNELKDGN